MAAPADLRRAHRQALRNLDTLTDLELRRMWRLLDLGNVPATRDALVEILSVLGERFGTMAAAVGADYYEALRDAQGARGAFAAQPAEPPTLARWRALAAWGVDPLLGAAPDAVAALARVSGGLLRSVRDGARDTVAGNAVRDRAAAGWRRVTSPEACKFCRMLAGRGGNVYTSSTVRFASHDHCRCEVEPAWQLGPRLTVMQYTASQRHISDRDRQRVRDWLATHDI